MTGVAPRRGPGSNRGGGAHHPEPAAPGQAPVAARERLSLRRAELLAAVTELGRHDPTETANLGFGKRIGDGTTYAVDRMNAAYQARTLYETVKEIDLAVARLDAGSYGLCTSCGNSIATERLALVPWAAMCIPCSGRKPRRR